MFDRLSIVCAIVVLVASLPARGSSPPGDGRVDAEDAQLMFSVWGTDGGDTGMDINVDGIVDAADAQFLFSAWTGDAPAAGFGQATAAYNPVSGLIEISANGVVNVFVESAGSLLTPGALIGLPPVRWQATMQAELALLGSVASRSRTGSRTTRRDYPGRI